MLSEVIRKTHKLRKGLAKVRLNSTLRLHKLALKNKKYARWHENRWHKYVHAGILAIYILSIIVGSILLPTQTYAALVTRSNSKTSSAEFAQGEITDLLNSDDALSMRLGKRVATGYNANDNRLSNFNNLRSIVRDSNGKIHITWVDYNVSPREIKYATSTSNGSTWGEYTTIATKSNLTGVLSKIDGTNRIHVFYVEEVIGANYIKHRLRGTDGNWGATTTVSNTSTDGAVADWQAVPQGDHYGNYYDTITGQWATVTRTTTKTIYDSVTGKIHDVPANYLGVRPYSNSQAGGLGYEALIEEARTNIRTNSYFSTDSNSDGLADSYATSDSSVSGAITSSIVSGGGVYGNGQRIQYTSANDVGKIVRITPTGNYTTPLASESWVASIYVKGALVGCSFDFRLVAYDAAWGQIGTSSTGATLTSQFQRVVTPPFTIPVGTANTVIYITINNVDTTDTVDLTLSSVQLEKGTFATSFIPTTTGSYTRNVDKVVIPTTGWNASTGSWAVVSGAAGNVGAASVLVQWDDGTDANRYYMYTTGNLFMNSLTGGTTYISIKTTTYATHTSFGTWNSGAPNKIYVDGVIGGTVSVNATTPLNLGANAYIGQKYNQAAAYNGPIHRWVVYNTELSQSEITARNSFINGTEESLMRTPIADWQAIPQGDHYGNFYDTTSGSLATVTRTTPKTIYDPLTSKIHDVPAGYLGVRPRSDGKTGYEAEIEEVRTNSILRSSVEDDTNADGWADNWVWSVSTSAGTTTPSLVNDAVYQSKGQRIQYYDVTVAGAPYFITNSYLEGFLAGEVVTGSVYMKGNANDCNPVIRIWGYDAANAQTTSSASTETYINSNTYRRYSFSMTLSANTTKIKIGVIINSVHIGDTVDMVFDAFQVEKGAFPTSYIPTTAAAYTRNADQVRVSSTNWSASSGTVYTEAERAIKSAGSYWSIGSGNPNTMQGYAYSSIANYGTYASSGGLSPLSYVTGLPAGYNYLTSSWQDAGKLKTTVNGGAVTESTANYAPVTKSATAAIGGLVWYANFDSNAPISRMVVYSAALSNTGLVDLYAQASSKAQISSLAAPFIDSGGNITSVYNKGSGKGIGLRTYASDSWSADSGVVASLGDHRAQTTLVLGSDIYYFYTLLSDNKRYLLKKSGGSWATPLVISDFGTLYASEIIDNDGNIWIFTADEGLSSKTLKYRRYMSGALEGAWTTVDAESGKHVQYPSATVDASGNVYVFYNIGNEISYKVYYRATSTWSNRASFTNVATHGETYFPNVRYQKNFNNSADIIDVLYRQNVVGTGSFAINYGTLGSGTTGTYISPSSGANVLSSPWHGGWAAEALVANINLTTNSQIKFEFRTGRGANADSIFWDDWSVADAGNIAHYSTAGVGNIWYVISAADMPILGLGTNRFMGVKITLESLDGTNVPILYDYTLNYLADENAPLWTYPESVPAFTDGTKTTTLTSNSFTDHNSGTSIYADWAGASEPVGESGISNYFVYFGPDNTANPLTAGSDKALVTEGTIDIATPVSGTPYYLRVSVKDTAGNILAMPSGESLFIYRFDNEKPKPPSNYSVNPVGWSTNNSFAFTWQAAIDPGYGASGIKGYEYKRAGGGDGWTYVVAAPSITIPGITSYQDGMNDFYIRSIDNAGNNSGETVADWAVVHYYYNGTAPSKPQNVQVDRQQNTENEFTFTWDEPASHNSDIKGYYYSINVEPTVTNAVFTTERTTGQIHAANQQGLNKFYVAAVDVTNDSVLGAISDFVEFNCNTSAPGIPGGVVISDSSNLLDQNWILTVAWNEPTGMVENYTVYRSTDGTNFANVGTTDKDNMVFSNSGLSNTSTYYYKIMAIDNAGAESGFSSVVSKQPSGKFVEPPIILSGPDVKATATSAVVTWTTNRASSSFVTASKTNDYQGAIGQLDAVTAHRVLISGLEPGATYNYKVQSFDENRDYATDDAYSIPYSFATQSAPGIAEVQISDIRLTSAIITWKTTTVASSTVLYGKTNTYGQVIEDKSGSAVTTHTIKLENLDHTTTYHFRIKGTDTDGNQLVSDDYSFDTLTYPKVYDIQFEQQRNTPTSTVKVIWTSNVPTTSVVEYAEDAGAFREVSRSVLETKHSVLVAGLKDNTPYRMVIKGRDAYGTEAVSDVHNVKTDFDTRPPGITDITTETSIVGLGVDSKGQIVVSWLTDEPATSQVEYGPGATGEDYSSKTQEDTSLTTSHVVIISDLKTSSPYHFRVISRDYAKNAAKSDSNSVLTDQASESVIDLIIKSLQSTIGWIFGVFNR